VWSGWVHSSSGDIETAKKHYQLADDALSIGQLNPSLSVLRHNVGVGSGSVKPVEATEDQIISFFLAERTIESDCCRHLLGDISEAQITALGRLEAGHHQDNIVSPRPHIMVMSTGRCGTMSLYKLFQGSNLEAYHSYWFMVSPYTQWEMACRLHSGNHESFTAAAEWASTRAAEWLGEKPMIGLNHTDTIFAPVFAAIHKKSKFIYLRRNPDKVFDSFYNKNQWQDGASCFRPIRYDFDKGYSFSLPEISEANGIRYHISETEKFSRTFGKVMGDRWVEISADKLFAQDKIEIAKLLQFTGSDIPLDKAVNHFKTKINEKAHKCRS